MEGAGRRAVPDPPRRQHQLRRLPQGRRQARLLLRRRRPALLQRQRAAGPEPDELRDDRHQARLPEALRPRLARLRPLPPPRHGHRARRAPAALPLAGQGPDRRRRALPRPRGAARAVRPLHRHRHPLDHARSCACSSSTYESSRDPLRRVKFRADLGTEFVTIGDDELQKVKDEFLNAEASEGAAAAPTKPREVKRPQEAAQAVRRSPGSSRRRCPGEDQAVIAAPKIAFPVYYPRLMKKGSRYWDGFGTDAPRTYTLLDEEKKKHRAYRMVIEAPGPRRVLRRPGHRLEGRADPRQPVRGADGPGPQAAALPRRQPPADGRLEDRQGRLLGLQHAAAVAHEPADAGHRPLALARRPLVIAFAAAHERATRDHRRHRHRLRRPGHGCRLRGARQRGLVHRHRRRQDRAPQAGRDPDLGARARGARGQAPRPPALLDRPGATRSSTRGCSSSPSARRPRTRATPT